MPSSSEPWVLTVVRLHGLRFLRPERSWRPIVTVTVDNHPDQLCHLGCDGQNINMKHSFHFHDVDVDSVIHIQVWKKPESKKKGKKKHLAGSTSLTFRELLKIQSSSAHARLKLNCLYSFSSRPVKGAAQNYANIVIRLCSPSSPFASSSRSYETSDEDQMSCFERVSDTLISEDDQLNVPITDQPSSHQIRRRRIQGYRIDSDDPSSISASESEEEYPSAIYKYPEQDEDSSYFDDKTWSEFDTEELSQEVQYSNTDRRPLSRLEAFINYFSPYQEMLDATTDADFQSVLDNLKNEWRWGMNIMMALCGLNATVFGFTPDVLFEVDSPAKRAIAVSGVSSGIGLVLNFWYQFLYSGAIGSKFRRQALDTFGTYFFFCLCCRLPTFLMVISSCALLGFMFLVSFTVWPTAVVLLSFFAGVLISLQYLLFGAQKFVFAVRWVFVKGASWVMRIWKADDGVEMRSTIQSETEKQNDTVGEDVSVKDKDGEKDARKDGVTVEVNEVQE